MSARVHHLTEALIHLTQKHGTDVSTQGFLAFLQNKKLLSFTPRIVKELEAKVRREVAYNMLKISVPYEPSESLVEYVKNYIHAQTGIVPIAHTIIVDPSLIGGFKATFRGIVFDGSISSVLQKIR